MNIVEKITGLIPNAVELDSAYGRMLKESMKRYQNKKILRDCNFVILKNLISDDSKRKRDAIISKKIFNYNVVDVQEECRGAVDVTPFSDSVTIYPAAPYAEYLNSIIRNKLSKNIERDTYPENYTVYIDSYMLEFLYNSYYNIENGNAIIDNILNYEIFDKLSFIFENDLDADLGFNILTSLMKDKRLNTILNVASLGNVLEVSGLNVAFDRNKIVNVNIYGSDYEKSKENNIMLQVVGGFISSEINRQLLHKKLNNYFVPPADRFANFIFAMKNSTTFWSANSTAIRIMAATFEISDASFNLEMIKRFHLSEALGGKVALPGTDIYDIKRVLDNVVTSVVPIMDSIHKSSGDVKVAVDNRDEVKALIKESEDIPFSNILGDRIFSSKLIDSSALLVAEMCLGESRVVEYIEEVFGVKIFQTETEKVRELSRKIDALRIQAKTITNKYEQSRASSFGHDIYSIIEDYEIDDNASKGFIKTLSGLRGDLDDIMSIIRNVDLERKRFNIHIPNPKGYEG